MDVLATAKHLCKALEENSLYATINYESLCKDAANDDVSPWQIRFLLTLLSV